MKIDLIVIVRDMVVDGGAVAVLVWDLAAGGDRAIGDEPDRIQSIPPLSTIGVVAFKQIPAGRYAVAALQLAEQPRDAEWTFCELPVAQIGSTGIGFATGAPLSTGAVALSTSTILTVHLEPVSALCTTLH
ncbi:MAG: hypothetical protein KJS95_08365 [Gammaproteobacteria bacterium]|nr:hypothetical protein [Gammaproteobacteria bacterium]